jgi:SAM-dependent methyltransferase
VTSTSSFGASRREGHDASAFYRRGLAAAAFSADDELAAVPEAVLDRVHLHSAEAMSELPDNSVGLMVISPPYHVGKDYDGDGSFEEYLEMLERVFAEVHRVLEPGGRAAVNVANLGRRPYLPLSHRMGAIMESSGSTWGRDHLAQGPRGLGQLRVRRLAQRPQPGAA